MKNRFVADGPLRFLRAKKVVSVEAIEKKYAGNWRRRIRIQKIKIRKRMVARISAREKIEDHQPSAGTLW